MNMKKTAILLLIIATVIFCVCMVVVTVNIVRTQNEQTSNSENFVSEKQKASESDTKFSERLESLGGTVIVISPDTDDPFSVSGRDMDTFEALIRTKLDSVNCPEAVVSRQGKTQFRVEIPDYFDDFENIDEMFASSKLEFLDADGNVAMDGSSENIKSAKAMYAPVNETSGNVHYVQLSFTKEGQKAFAKATEAAVNAEAGKNIIAIVLDGKVQMSPTVNEVINSNSCVITGDYDKESAEKVATLINTGLIPYSLKVESVSRIIPKD